MGKNPVIHPDGSWRLSAELGRALAAPGQGGIRGWSWDADGSVWKAARDSCLDVTPTMLSWIWGVLFCSLVRAAKAQLCGWPGLTSLLVDIR